MKRKGSKRNSTYYHGFFLLLYFNTRNTNIILTTTLNKTDLDKKPHLADKLRIDGPATKWIDASAALTNIHRVRFHWTTDLPRGPATPLPFPCHRRDETHSERSSCCLPISCQVCSRTSLASAHWEGTNRRISVLSQRVVDEFRLVTRWQSRHFPETNLRRRAVGIEWPRSTFSPDEINSHYSAKVMHAIETTQNTQSMYLFIYMNVHLVQFFNSFILFEDSNIILNDQ